MLEIIPNWHPVFVHFTVALLSLSVGLFVVCSFVKPPLQTQWLTVARWVLWFGAGLTVITGLTGLYAYNTVAHDTPSHAAMTDHRNWAIAAISLFLILAIWSAIRVLRKQTLGVAFVLSMVVAGTVLASTAWRGGELVYRFGLGVMSLPKAEGDMSSPNAEGDGHAHEHAQSAGHADEAKPMLQHNSLDMPTGQTEHKDDGHPH